jgi:hypothetical protein
MAAPLGFKTFNTGDVLSAADTNGYLMQGIWVFASAAARDAAVTSPQEGNSCYLKDTDVIQVYSGSSWVVKSGGSSPLTTKGDLYTYSTTDARLAVGANGTTLVADSAEATGLKWATPSGSNKSYTLLNTGGTALTGAATITVSGISGVDNLLVIIDGASMTGGQILGVRFNTDNGSNYHHAMAQIVSTSSYSATSTFGTDKSTGATSVPIAKMPTAETNGEMSGGFSVFGAGSTGFKAMQHNMGVYTPSGSNGSIATNGVAIYKGTAAITSVSLISSGTNFDAGTVYVYGA